jgi:glycine cleavage system H lipoate-binding protein
VAPLVPFSESTLSRCAGAGHRFCESYLALARPNRSGETPVDLLFAPNHMWLSVSEEGMCHLGLDAFAANVAHPVERVTFVTAAGTRRPTIALQVEGIEWPMTFPNPMLIRNVNTGLQTHPDRLSEDPYGTGWLFEGWEIPDRTRTGLIAGPAAAAWITEERRRLSRFVNDTQGLCADGGEAARGIAHLLPRGVVVALFQQFFGRTEWSVEE